MNHSNSSQNIWSLPKKSKTQLIWFSLVAVIYNLTHTQMCWGIKSLYFLKGGESGRHLGYTQRHCPLQGTENLRNRGRQHQKKEKQQEARSLWWNLVQWFPDPAICCFGFLKPTSSLTSLKGLLFRGGKKIKRIYKPSIFVCFGELEHLEKTKFSLH